MTQKPNILLIVVDQLLADSLSLCGNPVPETPALEKIAREFVDSGKPNLWSGNTRRN